MGRGASRERGVRGGGRRTGGNAEGKHGGNAEGKRGRNTQSARKSGGRHAESTWQERGRTKGSGGARGGVRNVASADVRVLRWRFFVFLRLEID